MSASSSSPASARSDARANRQRLIEAAEAVFAERGVHAEMKEIAERAGLGVGTIYRNFATKDELVAAIIDAIADRVTGELRSLRATPDPRARLEQLVRYALASAEANMSLFEALRAVDPARGHPPSALLTMLEEMLADIGAGGCLVPGLRPDVLARYLAAHFFAYVELRSVTSAADAQETLARLFLRAVLAQPGT
jgi:AcrR family transcriptional regulator